MKLIVAIVDKKDSDAVSENITSKGLSVTKLATVGGFLGKGNTTLLVGVDDDRVDEAVSTIKTYASRRVGKTLSAADAAGLFGGSMQLGSPIETTVGGATVFVLDIERYEKL